MQKARGRMSTVATMDDAELEAIYGPFAGLDPQEASRLLDGFPRPWWIGGGWAIEVFTGVSRPHEDLDICISSTDVPEVVTHFKGTHYVWAVGSGSLRPLTEPDDPVPDWAGQLWVREAAYQPWLLDFLLSPVADGVWAFKRDISITLPFEDATWVADDGIRYERPEVALLYKARHNRPKDLADLEVALPLVDRAAVDWLRSALTGANPGHPWLAHLG